MKKTNSRPIAYVLASTNHGMMILNHHDRRVIEGACYGVGIQILNTSSFDQPEVDSALQLLATRRDNFGDDVMALDCGANIGVHTVEWAHFMQDWGTVLAIEAQERIFYALAGNIALNNCFNARAIWAAVGSAKGSIDVPVPNYFEDSSFGSLEIRKSERTESIGQRIEYSPERSQATQLMAIDDLKLSRLDFLKIDIEGMEMEALHGASETLRRCKPQLMIERIKSNEDHLREYLSDHGYQIFSLGINLVAIHADDPAKIRVVSVQR